MPDRPDLTPFEAAPDFTFFHTPTWIATLCAAFPGWRDRSRIHTLPDGRRVWLPLLETVRVGPWRWLEGMPFGFYGGPVVEAGTLSRDDLALLLRELKRGAGWLALNLDPLNPLARPELLPEAPTRLVTHLLALDGGFEAVQQHFTKTLRYDIRRAGRDGVTARRGSGSADFASYHALMVRTAVRWNLEAPPYPAALYEALAQLPEDRVSLWLAEAGSVCIGGLINIAYHPQRVLHWSSALHPDYTHLNPTKVLQHAAIAEACAHGAQVYNLGPSVGFDGAPLDGVRQAKEALGGQPFEYAIPIMMNPWAMRARAALSYARRVVRR